jgi:heme A synthase
LTQVQKAGTAILLLLVLAGLAWWTLDGGPVRTIALLLLGLFIFRVVLYSKRSRYDKKKQS